MAVKIKKGTAIGTLTLTPLIDVVFLLLIFFLVATRFAQEDRELDVMLPAASEAKPLTVQPKEMFINVDHGGRYFVDGKTLNISPYNSDYENNVYALPPEPRAVSNALIGYVEE